MAGLYLFRSQCHLRAPLTPRDALLSEAKHISNLLYLVWMKMQSFVEYGNLWLLLLPCHFSNMSLNTRCAVTKHLSLSLPAPVTLNPNTGSKLLTISETMTRSSTSSKSQRLPDNPERSDAVLGLQGLSSGKHFWDVEVDGHWALGVAEESSRRSNRNDAWGIYICACTSWMHELTPREGKDGGELVTESSFPHRVRVLLDYNQGTLSFIDLDTKATVHNIKHTFGGTVFPYFEDNVKILPAKIF